MPCVDCRSSLRTGIHGLPSREPNEEPIHSISNIEARYDAEHNARLNAKYRQCELNVALHVAITRVDDLILRLGAHEEISPVERERLTSVPFFNP
jgi:hypothetical protein